MSPKRFDASVQPEVSLCVLGACHRGVGSNSDNIGSNGAVDLCEHTPGCMLSRRWRAQDPDHGIQTSKLLCVVSFLKQI